MRLIDLYKNIKPTIVAFCARYSADPKYAAQGDFPFILGTGFIIDSRGIILTNQHVVDQFQKLPKPPEAETFDAVGAMMFDQHGHEMKTPSFKVLGHTDIKSHTPVDGHFDRRPADLALVCINVYDLPTCKIRTERGGITEGLDIGTAGFPMGKTGLVDPADGLIQQLSPVLQRGIVSAIQPFSVDNPVSFTINILLQGGASGSPVFDIKTGEVIGVVAQRRYEETFCKIIDEESKEVTLHDGKRIRAAVGLPTNSSLVFPTYLIAGSLPLFTDQILQRAEKDQVSFKDYYTNRKTLEIKPEQTINKIQSSTSNQVAVRRLDKDTPS